MTELKPCFCCKCKPTVKRLRKNCYQVSCTNPMCFSVKAVCADTEEKAIIAWNRMREKMTIDEAIKERQKVIEVQEKLYEESSSDESKGIIKSAVDNDRQLAEWLTELKEAKRLLGEALRTLNDGSCNKDCRQCKFNNNGCEYGCRFEWKHSDEVSALIGEIDVDR